MKNKTSVVDVNAKGKKNSKLKISDIKKNSSSDITHTIKRIKIEENRIVTCLVICILLVFCIVGMIVFPILSGNDFNEFSSGPLRISFDNNENGMSDIINFTEKDGNPGEDGVVVSSTEFTITNDKGINSWYAVYLDDYTDMIMFDKCNDKQFNKDDIYFSIDNSEKIQLSSVDYGGRYVLTEGIVLSNDEVTHAIKVWHTGYSDDHYHGKIVVKYLR